MDQNRFDDFKKLLETMQGDFDKFYIKGNGAAGTRVRKHLQELAKLCKEVRNEVTAIKNARKEADKSTKS
ncbi:MAG: histone H1 [Actinobacteria bacterium]|nr:histone H1 [Actinomycetota bacterium]